MIERIIRWSVANRLFVLLGALFLTVAGIYSLTRTPVDALPDLSDTQVIIRTSYPGQAPSTVEAQVTYPLASTMLSAPQVKAVRGFSFFGDSFVTVLFQDGTDLYWARSRTLEYLSQARDRLPPNVAPTLGPDATGVGWAFEYALIDRSGRHDLAQLRSLQDWFLRYQLKEIDGVAEVASVGGMVQSFQVQLDPQRMQLYRVSVSDMVEAIRKANNEAGGSVIERAGAEYMVRVPGYLRTLQDFRDIPLRSEAGGIPVTVGDIARVQLAPEFRRGIAELNGEGEVAGGIIVVRQGADTQAVIQAVKDKLDELKRSLPQGVEVVTVYDRSSLIERAVANLLEKLAEELLIVALVTGAFLLHFRSSLVAVVTLPLGMLAAITVMDLQGVNANIMSLGGIAIAIGAMVDAAIVMIENAHKKLEHAGANEGISERERIQILVEAAVEVGPALFFSLLIITLSFLPVFTLEAQEGRLFQPLALTKTYSMAAAAALSITLVPVLMTIFIKGRIRPEQENPINRFLIRIYRPALAWVLRKPKLTLAIAAAALLITVLPMSRLGAEFMPAMEEGDILYMPTALPGLSAAEAGQLLQVTDRIIMTVPEVASVFGKAGRADTATDPAPFSMLETVVVLKPESEWPKVGRWYSSWAPDWLAGMLRRAWPDHKSVDEVIYGPGGLNEALQIPGVTNAWTMPIKGRIDMLTTGVRTPIGIKVLGADLSEIQRVGVEIEGALADVPGTKSVFAERTAGGYFLDFELKREQLARYGLSVEEANMAVMQAIGGENVSTTVEGRERYPINVRYMRDFRSDADRLGRTLVSMNGMAQIPLAELAEIRYVEGPAMLRDENGRLSGYVYVDFDTSKRDIGTYVEDAKKAVRERVKQPAGYELVWSGQFENMERAEERLTVVVPITIFAIFLLLYLNTRSVAKTTLILLAVPFSAVGAIWFLYALDYNMSVAVWVGLIALMGVDAETGMFMLLYLDLAYGEAKGKGRMRNWDDLREAVMHGAVKRLRPKVMTVGVMFMGLVPIMWSTGSGADVMKRIAAPMIGGIFTSFILELAVYPAIFALWKWHSEVKVRRTELAAPAPAAP